MRKGNGWIELNLNEISKYEEEQRIECLKIMEEAEKKAKENRK